MATTIRTGYRACDRARADCLSSFRRTGPTGSLRGFGGARRLSHSTGNRPPTTSKFTWLWECLKDHSVTCTWAAAIVVIELVIIFMLMLK